MYFRKSEVANDVFCNNHGGFCQSAMSNSFLVKGVGIESDKSSQKSLLRSAGKGLKKEKQIAARTGKYSFNSFAVSGQPLSPPSQVQIVYKTECQKEDNNIEKSTFGKEDKTPINANSYMSTFTSLKNLRSRRSLQRPRQLNFGLLKSQADHNLFEKYERKAHDEMKSILRTEHLEAPFKTRRQPTTKLNLQTPAAERQSDTEIEKEAIQPANDDEACENLQRLYRTRSAKVRQKKSVEINGGARKLNALNCALSRRSLSVDQNLEDEDYHQIDIEYLLKLKTVSRLSRMCDASAIEVVAEENSVKTETFLPPVNGSKWTLKDRYVAELNFNPPTSVLREYTRISQARVVDFSDAAVGNKVYIM